MKDINELLSLIRRTEIDSEIPQVQMDKFRSWLEMNRNLAYEHSQSMLTKNVDRLLKNGFVSAVDREEIITICTELADDTSTYTAMFDDLMVILRGIAANAPLADNQVALLLDYRTKYSNSIGQRDGIIMLIDSIVGKRTASSSELFSLVRKIRKEAADRKFEAKLSQLCGLVRARKNIGIELIDLLDSQPTINKIHERAETELLKELNSSGSIHQREIIFVSLVLIAMLDYNEGSYYDGVAEIYKRAYAAHSKSKIETLIRAILSCFMDESESEGRSRKINIALENAIVPQQYLAAFFEFIYDIYKVNFEGSLDDDLKGGFRFVYEGLRDHMLSDSNEITVNATQKTYKLIVSTKRLITQEAGLDAMIKLSIIIVKLIDLRFWREEVPIYNPYLKVGFEAWEKQLNVKRGRRSSTRNSEQLFRSSWEPKLCLRYDSVYLIPPAHSIKAQYEISAVRCIISNDDEIFFDGTYSDVREIIGGYRVSMTNGILIKKPLGRLSYKIVCGDEVIYDSRDKLFRRYIVFTHDGQELRNNTDYNGTALFCCDSPQPDMNRLLNTSDFCILSKNVKIGDTVKLGSEVFCFTTMIEPGVFGTVQRGCVLKNSSDRRIPVFGEIDFLIFETKHISEKFDIIIDGISHRLERFDFTVSVRDGISRYTVRTDIDTAGIHTIEVLQYVCGEPIRIVRQTFAYDPDLTIDFERRNDDSGKITVSSGLLESELNADIDIRTFDEDFIRFKSEEEEYRYFLPMSLGFYKLTDVWHSRAEALWKDDIRSETELTIYESECDRILACDENDKVIEADIDIVDGGYFKRIALGFLLSHKLDYRYIKLKFVSNNKVRHTLCCYNSCVISENDTRIRFLGNPRRAEVTPSFVGRNKVWIEISDDSGALLFKSTPLENGQIAVFEDYEQFKEYSVNFYEKVGLLSIGKKSPIYTLRKMFCSNDDFVGRIFKISTAYYDVYRDNEFTEKKCFFRKMYLAVDEVTDDNMLLGRILFKTANSERIYTEINPVSMELCGELDGNEFDAYIVNAESEDILMLDPENRLILDTMYDPKAPGINKYTLMIKEE